MTAPDAPEVTPPAAPVFGRRSTPLDERKYRTFGVEVETDTERFDALFEAYIDPDAGAILGLMHARTQGEQAQATAVLLGTSLRNDDGVPLEWQVPVDPVRDDDGEVAYFDDADDSPVEAAGDEPPLNASPRWEWHDGTLLTRAEVHEATQAFDPLAEGSSRRRFQYVMDSPTMRVQLDALTEIAEWIAGAVAKRPTRRPTPSQRGPQRTGRSQPARR